MNAKDSEIVKGVHADKEKGGLFVINTVSCSSGLKLTKDGGSWMPTTFRSIDCLLVSAD